VTRDGLVVLVDVERHEAQVGPLGREPAEDRVHHAAGRAPGRGEVDDDRDVALEDVGGEAGVGGRGEVGHPCRLPAAHPAAKWNP
jgi:hypothetical protein